MDHGSPRIDGALDGVILSNVHTSATVHHTATQWI